MRAKRTDKNHVEIANAFRQLGCSVADTSSLGKGYPDLTVGLLGKNLLVEVKNGTAKLNDRENAFHEAWKGQICVVRTIEEAHEIVKFTRMWLPKLELAGV